MLRLHISKQLTRTSKNFKRISRFCTLNKNHNGNHRKAVDVFTSFNSTKKDGKILKRIEKGRIEAQNKNDMSIFKEKSIQQVVCCKCIELGKRA